MPHGDGVSGHGSVDEEVDLVGLVSKMSAPLGPVEAVCKCRFVEPYRIPADSDFRPRIRGSGIDGRPISTASLGHGISSTAKAQVKV